MRVQPTYNKASHRADTKLAVDEFVEDVVEAHLDLLQKQKELTSLIELMERSGQEGPAKRLQKVMATLTSVLSVFRTLDDLYHKGELSIGPRARQVPQAGKSRMEAWQEKPLQSRPSRRK